MDELGNRMKGYEYVTRTYLPRRMPVIIRIDGRACHTFCHGFKKPFDEVFSNAMCLTAKELVENIPGCVFGYTQSDEISLLLKNDQTNQTQPWFDNNVSKILSISASMATLYFNRTFDELVDEASEQPDVGLEVLSAYLKSLKMGATFDSRVFVIPGSEIENYFIFRQKDSTRNSIQMVGQANFSHKELQFLKCGTIQEKLFQERGINWNDTPTRYKRGVAVYKKKVPITTPEGEVLRKKAIIDYEIPIFTEDRDFVLSKYTDVEE